MKTISSIISNLKPEVYFPLTVGSLPKKRNRKATAEDAIELQARHGIHFASTGEPTSANNESMEVGFFQAFEGIKINDKNATVVGDIKVKPKEQLQTLDIIREVENAKSVIDNLVNAGKYPDFIALKATLSGPGLLAQKVIDETNYSVQSLMGLFAEGLIEIACCMYDAGARIIQLDEPLFARGHRYRRETIQANQSILSQLRLRLGDVLFLSIHVCHEHSQETLRLLEKLDVDVLDLEFSVPHETMKNFNIITNEWLTEHEKNIGVGVITGESILVETDSAIKHIVQKTFESFDPEIVILKPDCQLRLLDYEVAVRKLERLNLARQKALELLNSS